MKIRTLLLLLASTTMVAEGAYAQDQSKRERENRDRIERLEKQVRQMQKKVFPDGQPASTAGFYDEPVATRSSVDILTGRIDSLERQMTTLIRNNEEAQFRLGQMETELARLRASQEAAAASAAAAAASAMQEPEEVDVPNDLISTPRYENQAEAAPEVNSIPAGPALAASDPDYEAAGEDAYTQGFRLWDAGNYDQAITTLRAFEAAFPDHPRASWARNLIGRALLDKGEPRAAANALLANYRKDPEGGRAADSLYFLGQSLMRLGQPGQACKAYAELEDVYAGNMRDYLTERLPAAKREADCG